MTTVTILAFSLLVVSGLIWRGTKGKAYVVGCLNRPILDLLNRGFEGGTLVIDELFGRRFLQLRKYIDSTGSGGIELAFPKVAWSERYFDQLVAFCEKENLNYQIEREDPDKAIEFLYLNFGTNVEGANECIACIYRRVFSVRNSTKLFVCLRGASVD